MSNGLRQTARGILRSIPREQRGPLRTQRINLLDTLKSVRNVPMSDDKKQLIGQQIKALNEARKGIIA